MVFRMTIGRELRFIRPNIVIVMHGAPGKVKQYLDLLLGARSGADLEQGGKLHGRFHVAGGMTVTRP